MSTEVLAEAAAAFTSFPEARALMVARHGTVVLEQYFHGMQPATARNVKSVTKSVQSALVGLALADGALRGLDERISDLMPSSFPPLSTDRDLSWGTWLMRSDSLRRDITVRDLLTMQTGLQGTDLNADYTGVMAHAPDQVLFGAALPMEGAPGSGFRYNTASAMLLNGVLAAVTGQSPRAYAADRLLTPLGGRIHRWTTDQAGLETGGAELFLTARDMMRLGLLYLGRGEYQDKRILPAEWVDASLAVQVTFPSPPEDPAATLLPGATGYGFMWWHRKAGTAVMNCAWGYGGQFICLVPSLDLAVVTLSSIRLNEEYHHRLFDVIDRLIVEPLAGR
jgi:CubicO group peptidase (beta-lactamase class C family)